MTDHPQKTLPQFYVTIAAPCPYLPGKTERKIFTHLFGESAQVIHDSLTASGFRRSQHVAYKPACSACNACVSARIPVCEMHPTRSQRRIISRNSDLRRIICKPHVSQEQYALLRSYLDARHPEGGMADMGIREFSAMVEETPVSTTLIEYRDSAKKLLACVLTDIVSDGLSMVYSFFDPFADHRSLGTFMVLDHVLLARERQQKYVYIGYWVQGCRKMEYKLRFQPLELLGPKGWHITESKIGLGNY